MGPEIPTPANTPPEGMPGIPPEENGFIKMAAELEAEKAAAPATESAPLDAPAPAEVPPVEQPPLEGQPPLGEQLANEPKPASEASLAEIPGDAGIPEPAKMPETATKTEASDTNTPERSPDFTAEEIADFKKYADKLEHDAKADLEMAELFNRFVDIASHQTSPTHPTPESTSKPAAPTSVDQPTAIKPAAPESAPPTPEPLTPESAIAAALAETDQAPIPGPVTIVTPAGDPGELLSAS